MFLEDEERFRSRMWRLEIELSHNKSCCKLLKGSSNDPCPWRGFGNKKSVSWIMKSIYRKNSLVGALQLSRITKFVLLS
jgi:hypothetical protein